MVISSLSIGNFYKRNEELRNPIVKHFDWISSLTSVLNKLMDMFEAVRFAHLGMS